MKKNFLIIILILLVVTAISVYAVYTYRTQAIQAQKVNKEYKAYYNVNFLGTQLISIINKTMDYNQKNEIEKDKDNKYYIDNEKNSIKIYVQFIYKNETKIVFMEDIASSGSQSFVNRYSTAKFKCTKIDYHEKTKNVKSLTFEEIQD